SATPEAARWACELTTLAPAGETFASSLEHVYELTATGLRFPVQELRADESLRRISLALVDLRRGRYQAALEQTESCIAEPMQDLNRAPLLLAGHALALHELHRDSEAGLAAAFARQMLATTMRTKPSNSSSNEKTRWFYAMEGDVLLREVNTAIGG